jgi:hypothetical protein
VGNVGTLVCVMAVAVFRFIRRQTAQRRTFPRTFIGAGGAFLLVIERQIMIMGRHNAPPKIRITLHRLQPGYNV